jgi:hypothetical protein
MDDSQIRGLRDLKMPIPSHSLKVIESYTQNSVAHSGELAVLRRLAALDQGLAKAEDDWFLTLQDSILAASTVFDLQDRLNGTLRNYWYELGATFDPNLEKKLLEGYRQLVKESDELLGDVATLRTRGRLFEGIEVYEEQVRRAREFLVDDALRKQAERQMPTTAKLDALADAHLRGMAR